MGAADGSARSVIRNDRTGGTITLKDINTSLIKLFLSFAKMGVMTFGGGYAMLPILQREVVEKNHWATDVGRILRTFKIKKNVEVTDNGKDNF